MSGNLAAKSSAAFSAAAGSVSATAALYASNSGCVLACGGRLPAGAAGCAAWPCPAGGACEAPLSCAISPAHIPNTAITTAARLMPSPRGKLILDLRFGHLLDNREFYRTIRILLAAG